MAENEAPKKIEAAPASPVAVEPPVAKVKAEPLVPLTAEEVAAKVEQIVTRVKEVGLRAPLRALFTPYAKQVTSVLDGVLGAFDDGPPKKKG